MSLDFLVISKPILISFEDLKFTIRTISRYVFIPCVIAYSSSKTEKNKKAYNHRFKANEEVYIYGNCMFLILLFLTILLLNTFCFRAVRL